jgi:uncharacterized protein (TIGR02217 family)
MSDVIFPTDISFNSPGGPMFLTNIAEVPSGWSQRNVERETPLCLWDVGYGARTIDKIDALYRLFMTSQGAAQVVLFKYWLDFKSCNVDQIPSATDQVIATATAGQTNFQLIKKYEYQGRTLTKTIYKPRTATLLVSVDGVTESSGWTMNIETGVITRSVGLTAGRIVRAGYEYYHPARFKTDSFTPSFRAWQAGEVDVQLCEVRL